MTEQTILVLGGGVGGLVASNLLKKKLGDRANVMVVERKREFQFPPSYPWLMLGMRKPEQVQKSLTLLERKGIDVVNDEVLSIDVEGKNVKTRGDKFSFDYLIIALGAEYAPEVVPGFREHAHHIYDLESALRFKESLQSFSGSNISVGVSRTPFKCPAAPYESALLLDHHFKKNRNGSKVRIRFFTPEGLPLPSAGPDIGNGTVELMKSRGIETKFKTKLTEVRSTEAVFEDGSTIPFDLLLAVPPHKCPQSVMNAGLTDETGWVPVNPTTMETKHDNVYGVGDVTSVPTPSGFVPYLPKAGVFAHRQAETVSHNIAVRILGKGSKKEYDGSGECFLMTGGTQAAFVKGTWFATPHPTIKFHSPSRTLYTERVLFEKYWMRHWF
ncbi:MAG TPA: FAD/NAD(P)-binding oxidoreductase [Candidatus Bathyarchaeia archaeon]|nr:FAD/NAD(P)-binding oxidoreductase [Candidatus Bathyarchaeia archaeon]